MEFEPHLFDLSTIPTREKTKLLKNLQTRVWTTTKAQFIARYLRYFVYITKHGTYLDAFAGPQDAKKPDSWAANLVLRNKPPWLKHFVLFELNRNGLKHIENLKTTEGNGRDITVVPGDTNVKLPEFLKANPIKDTEATFCLLDQRTFECDWETVKAVAGHKNSGKKIEILYFLAQGWLGRAISGLKKQKDTDLRRWWGSEGWSVLTNAHRTEQSLIFAKRFKDELGYKSANSYPIFNLRMHLLEPR
jgi:three-Cys-motif partner protein